MSDSRYKAQRKYDAAHCTVVGMKLNNKYDKEILDRLKSVSSKQGYLKELIKRDIESNPLPDVDVDFEDVDSSLETGEMLYPEESNVDSEDVKLDVAEENQDHPEDITTSESSTDVSDRERFRRNLAELMRTTKVKQVDLAKKTGVSYQTVSAWIAGRGYPRPEAMERICQFFGVKQSALIEKPANEGTEEDVLLAAFRTLSRQGKEKLIERAVELMKLHPKREDV